MYDNAYYDKGRSSGVCIALAATFVYVRYYCVGLVTIGHAYRLLNMNMNI